MSRCPVRCPVRCLLLGLLLASLSGAAGCNVIGFAADAVAGGRPTPPQHELPPGAVLVVAESYRGAGLIDAAEAELIARTVSERLRGLETTRVVEPTRLRDFQSRDRAAYRGMTVDALGREFGADMVIYANVRSFDLEQAIGSEAARVRAEALVRVVAAADGATLWPGDAAAGRPVAFSTPMLALRDGRGVSDVRLLAARGLAEHIAGLFFPTPAPN